MIYLYMLLGGAVGMAATFGYGYWQGYKICNTTAQVKALTAENKRLSLSLEYMKSANQLAQEKTEEAIKIDQINKDIIDALQQHIKAQREAKSAACVFDDDFLRRVDKLQ